MAIITKKRPLEVQILEAIDQEIDHWIRVALATDDDGVEADALEHLDLLRRVCEGRLA